MHVASQSNAITPLSVPHSAKVITGISLIVAIALMALSALNHFGSYAWIGYTGGGLLIAFALGLVCYYARQSKVEASVDTRLQANIRVDTRLQANIRKVQEDERLSLNWVKNCIQEQKLGINDAVPLKVLKCAPKEILSRDPNTSYYEETFLHLAAEKGYTTIINYLIGEGADVNCKDKQYDTPLHYAANKYHKAAMDLLKANGAFFRIKNSHGMTADAIYERIDANKSSEMKEYISQLNSWRAK